ncbi:MAG: hypothetical protein AAF585_08760 [Verrucomicrobiota bacterium]
MTEREKILQTLEAQNGVIFAEPEIVFRESYSGRDILAPNKAFTPDRTDERGYLPVERWVMSVTFAENPKFKEGEGLTKLRLVNGGHLQLREALEICRVELFGEQEFRWPLTKVLDIGGEPLETSFGTCEVPPIPCHVHGGDIVDGKPTGQQGKREAYFFPPLDVPPYNKQVEAITRLGVKADATPEEFVERMKRFGKDDSVYELLVEYPIKPYSGWTIYERLIHAPGPWTTFEIQLPQDDFNLLSWRLGERLDDVTEAKDEQLLRGLVDEEAVMREVIDWDASQDPNFEQKYHHQIEILEEGGWGRRYRIFYDVFYGEGWEVETGASANFAAKDKPIAGFVWSGSGELNGTAFPQGAEFLITPRTESQLTNTGATKLIIYTFEPLLEGVAPLG